MQHHKKFFKNITNVLIVLIEDHKLFKDKDEKLSYFWSCVYNPDHFWSLNKKDPYILPNIILDELNIHTFPFGLLPSDFIGVLLINDRAMDLLHTFYIADHKILTEAIKYYEYCRPNFPFSINFNRTIYKWKLTFRICTILFLMYLVYLVYCLFNNKKFLKFLDEVRI